MNLKIVVTGAYRSGKTQFCETISDKDRRDITGVKGELVHHYWHFAISKMAKLKIFEAGGSRRYDYMWEILDNNEYGKFIGFVVLVDAARTETFRECNSIIQTFLWYAPFPFVIVANKQDIDGAWSAEDLRILWHIPPKIPIIPCVASDKKSVANVLIALCEEVLHYREKEEETET